jgi:hypothetical protein
MNVKYITHLKKLPGCVYYVLVCIRYLKMLSGGMVSAQQIDKVRKKVVVVQFEVLYRQLASPSVRAVLKAWVCGRSLAGIADSNPAGGMDVCLLNRSSAIVSTRTDFPISSGRHKQCLTSVLGALQHAYESKFKFLFTLFFKIALNKIRADSIRGLPAATYSQSLAFLHFFGTMTLIILKA